MENVETIIQTMFGGEITVQGILTVAVSIYAVIMSIVAWRSKVKAIKADRDLTSSEQKLDAQKEELNQVKQGIKYLGDMICTAYLTNPNVDEETKKKIAVTATNLEKVANIELSEMAGKLIDTVTEYIPGTNLEEKKEDIIAEVKATEQIIDSASEAASDIVNRLEV